MLCRWSRRVNAKLGPDWTVSVVVNGPLRLHSMRVSLWFGDRIRVTACPWAQELEWSFRLFKEMREQGTMPNSVTCSALMDACLKAGELDPAFAVLEHMLDVGIEPTKVTLTLALTQTVHMNLILNLIPNLSI